MYNRLNIFHNCKSNLTANKDAPQPCKDAEQLNKDALQHVFLFSHLLFDYSKR